MENPLTPMGMPNARTAAMSAISRLVTLRSPLMNNDQFKTELSYQISLALAEKLHTSELLTDKEFSQTKALLLQKYSPPIGLLFAEIA